MVLPAAQWDTTPDAGVAIVALLQPTKQSRIIPWLLE
jgi:hypothetical protein